MVWVTRDAIESWEEANSQLHLPLGQENLKVSCQLLDHVIPDGELPSQGGGLVRRRRLRRLERRSRQIHHGFASETETRSASESINRSNNLTNILQVIRSKKSRASNINFKEIRSKIFLGSVNQLAVILRAKYCSQVGFHFFLNKLTSKKVMAFMYKTP